MILLKKIAQCVSFPHSSCTLCSQVRASLSVYAQRWFASVYLGQVDITRHLCPACMHRSPKKFCPGTGWCTFKCCPSKPFLPLRDLSTSDVRFHERFFSTIDITGAVMREKYCTYSRSQPHSSRKFLSSFRFRENCKVSSTAWLCSGFSSVLSDETMCPRYSISLILPN